jgi:pimeloyl-ACP methyl ester carboxylesterase
MQTVAGYAQAVLDWLQAVELPRAVFVGHSMGSAIVLRLALDHPERVLGLGLAGAGARLRVHPDILNNLASESTFLSAVKMVIEWAFSPQAAPRLVESAAKRMAETRPSVLHGDFLACDTFDVREQIAEIRQPALVICGADDFLTPPRYAQFLADRMPAARLVIVPNTGHMVMLEQPQAFTAALLSFLEGISL